MRGHMQQRGPRSWRLKVFLGRDSGGGRRYLERTVSGTRRDAEKELARLVVEVDDGRHVASAPMTFGELLDRWLALKATTVEPTSVEGYRWVVERYARPTFGDRKVDPDSRARRLVPVAALGRRCRRPAAVGPHRADLPHGHAPVARPGA